MAEVIPAQAVEAATDALIDSKLGDHAGINGEEFIEAARLALEAAAPHMLAAAWDEGKNSVWTFLGNQDPRRERPTNPYRPTP